MAAYTDGNIEIYFQYFKEPYNTYEAQNEFRKKLMEIKGVHIDEKDFSNAHRLNGPLLKMSLAERNWQNCIKNL